MKERVFLKNIIKVVFSNLTVLGLSFLINLILPIFLEIADYGYYQKFILYASYLGIFMIGYNDGINIRFASFSENTVNKPLIRMFFRVAVIWCCVLTSIAVCIVLFLPLDKIDTIVYLALAIEITLFNVNGFFTHINQIMERFNLYSIGQMLSKIAFLLFTSLALIFKQGNYILILALYLLSNLILLTFNLFTSKQYSILKGCNIKDHKEEIQKNIKIGLWVMLSSLLYMFILTYPKIMIEKMFSINQFSYFSYAISLLSICSQLFIALSVVLFPMVKKLDIKKINFTKDTISKLLFYLGAALMLAYYPIFFFVKFIIVKYSPLLEYLLFIFPLIIYQARLGVVIITFFKTINKVKELFISELCFLIISVLGSLLAFYLTKNIFSIIISFICFIILGTLVMQFILNKIGHWKNKWYEYLDIAYVFLFIILNWQLQIYIALPIYISYITIMYIVLRKDIKALFLNFKRKKI